MRKAWVLSRMYINSLYGLSGFINDLKKNRKSAIKTIGLIVLIIFSLSGFVSMFVVSNIKIFDILKAFGQQGIVITNTIIFSVLFTIIFGFMGVIGTYFIDKEGDIILSMPLKPWEIFFSKFATNYVYEAIVSLIIMATGFIVYGVKSGEGILFYLISIIVALILPVIPLSINYFIIIPIMKMGNILKKKDSVMMIGGLIGIGFAIALQGITQSLGKSIENPEMLAEKLASPNGLVSIAGKAYFPSIWATHAIVDSGTFSGVIYLLIFIGISSAAFIGLLSFMSNLYVQSVIGSGEVRKVNRKYDEKELKNKYKQQNVFYSMLKREIRLMNREPVHFLNGPMVILIMPLIFGAMIYFQGNINGLDINKALSLKNANYYLTLGIAAVGVFLGVSTNITSSCISREGKTFMHIKSMPVSPKQFITAKIVHGTIFSVIASLLMAFIGYWILKMPLLNASLSFVVSIIVALPLLLTGVFVDLTWPKLDWDNPTKAMKQNVNVVIIMFGQMFVLLIEGLIIINLIKVPFYSYVTLIVFSLVISGILFKFLLKYSVRRFYEIEV
jgi:ABC-2 type transport system permease protein